MDNIFFLVNYVCHVWDSLQGLDALCMYHVTILRVVCLRSNIERVCLVCVMQELVSAACSAASLSASPATLP